MADTLPRTEYGEPDAVRLTNEQSRQLHIRHYDILHRLHNAIMSDRWDLLAGISKTDICYAIDHGQGLVYTSYVDHWTDQPFPDRYDKQDRELPVWEVR